MLKFKDSNNNNNNIFRVCKFHTRYGKVTGVNLLTGQGMLSP